MRRESNLDKLPKTDWNYNALQEMRNMWHSYMTKCLASLHLASEKVPDVTDNKYAQFHSVLAKSELTGANITVEKSNNPSYVGMEGTIVLETQQTFQIVTPKNQLKSKTLIIHLKLYILTKFCCSFVKIWFRFHFPRWIYAIYHLRQLVTHPTSRTLRQEDQIIY